MNPMRVECIALLPPLRVERVALFGKTIRLLAA
jgi:hypothetical protein